MTIAVLVNGVPETDADGQTRLVSRPDAELDTLRQLVASASGYDESRGDQITVKSLPFATIGSEGTLAKPDFLDRLELNGLARIALIGLFALAVIFAVLRPVLRSRAGPAAQEPGLDDSLPLSGGLNGVIEPEDEPLVSEPQLMPELPPRAEPLALPSADPVARLRGMMRERHDESVKILSGWIDNKEKAH